MSLAALQMYSMVKMPVHANSARGPVLIGRKLHVVHKSPNVQLLQQRCAILHLKVTKQCLLSYPTIHMQAFNMTLD